MEIKRGGGRRIDRKCKQMVRLIKSIFIMLGILLSFPTLSFAATPLHDKPPGTIITFSDKQWMILDQKPDGTTYIILNSNNGDRAFDPDNTQLFNPTDSNNIGYYLNNTFYNSLSQKDLIVTHSWDIKFEDGSGSQENVTCKIALISYAEYQTYRSLFPANGTTYLWWTRTPERVFSNRVYYIDAQGKLTSYYANYSRGVRPTLYLQPGLLVTDTNEVFQVHPPLPPAGLSATATGPTQVELTWQPNTEPDLAGYIIYRNYVEIARVGANATSYTDSNVQPNTTYTYGIKAYNTSNVESGMSNAATVTTPQAPTPATPNSLTATAIGPAEVKLTWQPNTDPYLTGYIIYRDYVEIARVGAEETSYTDTGLSPNTTYTYGIRAYNIWGVSSDMSNAAIATTPPSIVATPQGLTATALTYNQILLTWQPNTDPGLAGYIIYRNYVEIARVGPSETSYLDTGVQPNTTYTYGIKAYDSSNNLSDISNAATVTTPPEIAAPTGLKATASFDHVQLSWNPNTEPTLAGYIIYRDYIEIARVGAGETSYVDNNINPNTRYIYGIKAYSTSGFISAISNAATVTTPASPKPIVTARVDGRTIKISWTSSGSGYTYKVLVNEQEVTSTSTTSCNYTASTPGYYTVQVVAVATSGEQYPSDKVGVTISSITTPGASQMVTDLISNIGMLMVPTGGLVALYFGLKASPILIEAIKAFMARRL
ncbi:MAG: fibronectin type III domain-containing protein [Moorellaceae bacterium]